MNEVEHYGIFIAEESIIRLTDGTEMKGTSEVTKGILDCCETYHIEHVKNELIGFAVVSTIIVGTGIGISKVIKWRQNKNKQISKD